MNKFVWIIGIVVFLSLFSVNAELNDDSLNVFSVSVVDQSPPIVPAIALEQRSDARVKVFLSVTPMVLGNVVYDIDDVLISLYKADGSNLISSVYTDTAINSEDVSYNNILNPFNQTIAIANVKLRNINTGSGVRIVEDETAEKICSGEINDTKSISDLIPDELNVTMKVGVKFRACKDGTFDEKGKCSGILLSYKDYMYPGEYNTEEEIRRCQDNNVKFYSGDDLVKANERCKGGSILGGYIVDYVYVDTVIGIDKTNLDLLVSPEQLKKQICDTIKWREGLDKILDKTKKVKNVFESTCLISVLGGAFNILRGDTCDALDTISLGCDWIFCPSQDCHGMDPMNSIVTATVSCWDFNKRFFNKDLGFNIKDPNDFEKTITTYNPQTRPESYKSVTCDYENNDTSGSIPFPHYACVTGVESNLEVIDKMVESYQECLIQARLGGVSVGMCDKLRSYFLCDRVLGEALAFTGQSSAQGWLGKFFSVVIGKPLDLIIPGNAQDKYKDRKTAASDLAELSRARYDNVPFIQMTGKEGEYLKNQFCLGFIRGDLFSLEGMKQSMSLLDVDYPDSAFIITEKRDWSKHRNGSGNLITDEWSYDVFFQVYNGEKSQYGSAGNYNVFLKGLSGSNCGGYQTIQIANGYVKKGEMVQDNVFKTYRCDASEQCLTFKGQTVCAPIVTTEIGDVGRGVLTFATGAPYDPFGLTLFDKGDGDGDGYSDNWETKYFGLKEGISAYGRYKPQDDNDKDGYCNAEEYLAGTDPTSSVSHPTSAPDCDSAVKVMEGRRENNQASVPENGITQNENVASSESIIIGNGGDIETTIVLNSVKIDDEIFSGNYVVSSYVNNGGKYDITFEFDKEFDNCEINNMLINFKSNKCFKNNINVFGDGVFVSIEVSEENYGPVEIYIANNEKKVPEDKFLKCSFYNIVDDETVYSCVTGGRRCSDYILKEFDNSYGIPIIYPGPSNSFYNSLTSCKSNVQNYETIDLNGNLFEKSYDWS